MLLLKAMQQDCTNSSKAKERPSLISIEVKRFECFVLSFEFWILIHSFTTMTTTATMTRRWRRRRQRRQRLGRQWQRQSRQRQCRRWRQRRRQWRPRLKEWPGRLFKTLLSNLGNLRLSASTSTWSVKFDTVWIFTFCVNIFLFGRFQQQLISGQQPNPILS